MTASGKRTHWITLSKEGDPVADGDGSFTRPLQALTPASAWASIEPATARTLERVVAGTVAVSATHLITFPYHAQVTEDTVITEGAQIFRVTGVHDPGFRHVDTVAICVEHRS